MESEQEVAREKKQNVNIGAKKEINKGGMEYDDIMKL